MCPPVIDTVAASVVRLQELEGCSAFDALIDSIDALEGVARNTTDHRLSERLLEEVNSTVRESLSSSVSMEHEPGPGRSRSGSGAEGKEDASSSGGDESDDGEPSPRDWAAADRELMAAVDDE